YSEDGRAGHMGKRSAVVELFLGDMGSMQRELRPSIQREDQPTMETKLEQIAVKAVNQLPKSGGREIRPPRAVGAGGGRPPPATRWAVSNDRPYRASQRAFPILTLTRHWTYSAFETCSCHLSLAGKFDAAIVEGLRKARS